MNSPTLRIAAAMRDQRGRLVGAALLGFVASASAVALLGTSGWLISRAAEMPPVLALSVAAVLVRSFALSRSVFRYLERLVGHDAAFRGLTGLRVTVYERLVALAPVGLARFRRGDLLARLVADVDTALDLPLRVILPWAQAILVSIGTVVFMSWLVPGAGVVVAIALGLGITVVPWLIARVARHAERRLAPVRGDVSGTVVTSLEGGSDLLAFGVTAQALERVRDLDRDLERISRRESIGLGLGGAIGIAVQGAAVIAALVVAIPAVVDGRLAPVWLAVAALVPLAAYDIVSGLPASALALQRVRASASRISDVLDEPVPVEDPVHPEGPPLPPFALDCRGLSARWAPDAPPTLRGIDLTLQPGERIAVVGPSGAGKSTLAAVLLRFLPYEGSVTLGGREIARVTGDAVRSDVGLLTQSADVFDTSVAANLRLGSPEASKEQMIAVLDRVRLSEWLASLPRGLDTEVGPHGATMSGGERQRLALARLLLAGRRVVVLDEPTEHLDPETADALAADLLRITEGQSTLLITHRLTGLNVVDRILVLVSGEIVASGTHDELLSQGGWYAERWRAESERLDLAAAIAGIPPGSAVENRPGVPPAD